MVETLFHDDMIVVINGLKDKLRMITQVVAELHDIQQDSC